MMTVDTGCCRPNFFLIGAAKCGTTSVASYLDQHPEVYVSKPKEPNFFSFEPNTKPECTGPVNSDLLHQLLLKYSVTNPDAYEQLFSPAGDSRAIGEASVRYLYDQTAITRIADYAPQAKLIVLLRAPVDRLHSHYHMNVRQHIEPETLADAIAAEDDRVAQGWGWDWHYRRVGNYAAQLEHVYSHFDRSQVLVLFHADLQRNPAATMRSIFTHLEVASDFQPNFERRAMVGHTPRWRSLRRMIRDDNVVKHLAKRVVPRPVRKSFAAWTESKNRQAIPKLDDRIRKELESQFLSANSHLADLLELRLPW